MNLLTSQFDRSLTDEDYSWLKVVVLTANCIIYYHCYFYYFFHKTPVNILSISLEPYKPTPMAFS